MKYVIALVFGILMGAAATALVVYSNPFFAASKVSPLAVTDNEVFTLGFSAVPEDSLLLTNDGNSAIKPHPGKVLQLWEPTIRHTTIMTTLLTNSRGELAGIGIKFASASERTRLIDGAVLVDSAWHVYLPQRGSFFVEQTENRWSYLRDVVVPAHWSSGDNWKGAWRGNLTAGPTALSTARVYGGSGEFANVATEAVETLSARAYAVGRGPVAAEGELMIELPGRDDADRVTVADD